jgi:hypothetical protein
VGPGVRVLADPKRATWKAFARYGIYVVDAKGRVRARIAGTKTARPRLDLVLRAVSQVTGKPAPKVSFKRGRATVEGSAAPAKKLESAKQVLGLRWMASHNVVRPGDEFKLACMPTIAGGYSVYGPRDETMTPLRVKLKLPPGITLEAPLRYPRPTYKVDKTLKTKLSTYSKEVPLGAIRLRASKDLTPGKLVVRVEVTFQACDASSCFPPTTKVFELPLVAVAEGRRAPVFGWERW